MGEIPLQIELSHIDAYLFFSSLLSEFLMKSVMRCGTSMEISLERKWKQASSLALTSQLATLKANARQVDNF